jgi:hypothetical protein
MRLDTFAWALLSLAIVLFSFEPTAPSETGRSSQWLGLWQAQLDGQPGVILTLGDDTGQLGGAVVFNMVSREGGHPHVIGHDAHVLRNPRIEGDTLHFQVIRRGDNRQLDMTVHMNADGAATLHCLNCGDDAPVVDIVKER